MQSSVESRDTRLSTGNGIRVDKKIRNQLSKQNFSYRAVDIWNKLPQEIRLFRKLPKFKQKLKEWTKRNVPVT